MSTEKDSNPDVEEVLQGEEDHLYCLIRLCQMILLLTRVMMKSLQNQ